MDDRGDRRSQWTVIRRCVMLVARLLKSPASNAELLAIVSVDENVPKDVLQKRFENDRQRLRELGCKIHYRREEDLYELSDAGIFQELIDAVSRENRKSKKGVIAPETFIRVYQSSETIEEVQQRLGLTGTEINARAHAYRRHGVNLKQIQRGGRRKKNDWSVLARLAESVMEDKSDGND